VEEHKCDGEIEEVTIRINGFLDFVHRLLSKKNTNFECYTPSESTGHNYFIYISNYIVIEIIAFCLFGFTEIQLKIAKNNLTGNWIGMIFPVLHLCYE
jgi:hypothetical protein